MAEESTNVKAHEFEEF
jgi:CHASE3 domain sensor protein